MKKYFLVVVLAISNSMYSGQAESTSLHSRDKNSSEDTDSNKSNEIIKGKFTLQQYPPSYAGYENLCTSFLDSISSQNKKRIQIKPDKANELLFKISTAPTFDSNATQYERESIEQKWDNFQFPDLRYAAISNLEEGVTLEFTTRKTQQKVWLTINTPHFSENDTFQKILIGLLAKVKDSPNYCSWEKKKLIYDGILVEKESISESGVTVKKISHGPNGFDFSILEQPKEKIN